MNDYRRLADEAERPPKRVVDHSEAWERLTPLLGLNGSTRERVQAFTERKRISLEALIALGTRVKVDAHGGVELAWAYRSNGSITAVKFRPLGDKQRYALAPSVFLEPLVIGTPARSIGSSPRVRQTAPVSSISSATSPRCSCCRQARARSSGSGLT
jgi:hypothetical protein